MHLAFASATTAFDSYVQLLVDIDVSCHLFSFEI